jgi:hypothetical protein
MANEKNLKVIRDSKRAAEVGRLGGLAKKGSKHINHWVQEILQDENFEAWIQDPKEGVKLFQGAPLKAMIKAQTIKAVNGDTKAYDSLVKSGWVQRSESELTVKELPKPLLGGINGVPSNDSDQEAS